MMKQSYWVWDFMIAVIGEKYRLKDSAINYMTLQQKKDEELKKAA